MPKSEPTAILYALNAAVSASQVALIPMPVWAHALALGVSGGLTAALNRALVIPANKIGL